MDEINVILLALILVIICILIYYIYKKQQESSFPPPAQLARPVQLTDYYFRTIFAVPKGSLITRSDQKRIDYIPTMINNTIKYFKDNLGKVPKIIHENKYLQLEKTESELANGDFTRENIRDQINKLLNSSIETSKNIYIVFYIGNYPSCGASYPPELFGKDNVLVIPIRDAYKYACDWTNNMYQPPYKYIDYVLIHEMIHAMGFVPSTVNGSGLNGHFLNDRSDIMWAGSGYRNDLTSALHISDNYKNLLIQSKYLNF